MSYKEILFYFVPNYSGTTCKYCHRCKYSECKTIDGINNLYCIKFKHLFKTKDTEFPSYYWQQACCFWKDKYR